MAQFVFGVMSCGVLVVAFIVGWVSAHDEIARECERQGNFYYGPKTFTCAAAALKEKT